MVIKNHCLKATIPQTDNKKTSETQIKFTDKNSVIVEYGWFMNFTI